MKACIFAGTFDPITVGHLNIIQRALKIFDKVYIAILNNASKKTMFTLEKRLQLCKNVFKDNENVEVISFDGLLVDLCDKLNVYTVIRGVRNAVDYAYETNYFVTNVALNKNIDIVIFPTCPEYQSVSSSVVRELITFKKSVKGFIPKENEDLIN